MVDDICRASAERLLELYRKRELSPAEATAAVLRGIEAGNPRVNAFCLVDAEAAMASARAAEARWRKGTPCGPLDGVPVSIKDLQLTKGWPTLKGSRTVDPNQPWTEDAPSVARLREAGAVLVGKTTTPEFGWKGVTDGPLTGITRNPWDPRMTPGGSSGGATAALAAGMGPLATGTDGAGSIRIPASFTGVFGLKPTNGRVPHAPASAISTMAHAGPLARTVRDAALMMNVIAQFDPRDPYGQPIPVPDYLDGIEAGAAGLRVAYVRDFGFGRIDPEVAAAVDNAARALAGLGARVEPRELDTREIVAPFVALYVTGSAHGISTLAPAQRALLEPRLERLERELATRDSFAYLKAVAARERFQARMNEFFRTCDLLITPTMPIPAFAAGLEFPDDSYREWWEWSPFTYPFDLTMQPAASAPCGFTTAGLPIGLHIVGQRFADALVLRAARAYERAHPFRMPWDR
jgi:aspartyl-tRNA(Asn)/glutamyl-tRNA(Gln) amidotransferase subunit A